jgi:hypothetical protein
MPAQADLAKARTPALADLMETPPHLKMRTVLKQRAIDNHSQNV